jgi:hypothetical protein
MKRNKILYAARIVFPVMDVILQLAKVYIKKTKFYLEYNEQSKLI